MAACKRAVATHLSPTVNVLVRGFEQTPAAGERGALGFACIKQISALATTRLLCYVFILACGWGSGAENFSHIGITLGCFLVDGCAWIPSHDKVPWRRPPERWLDVCFAACSMPKRMLVQVLLLFNFGR